MARLRLMGAVLHNLEFEGGGRAALATLTLELLERTGATQEDSEGLINIPLTVKEIQAVAFLKEIAPDSLSREPAIQGQRRRESRRESVRRRGPQERGRMHAEWLVRATSGKKSSPSSPARLRKS
jgi:nanoRNase/pAp phosphatase (c-di-AMP/oligoRNAs hydrolase)